MLHVNQSEGCLGERRCAIHQRAEVKIRKKAGPAAAVSQHILYRSVGDLQPLWEVEMPSFISLVSGLQPSRKQLELKVYRNVLELVLFNLENSVVSFLIYSMAGVPALLEIYSIVEKGPGAESNWTLNHIKWKLMVGGDTSNERKNCGAARKKGKVTEIKN